MSSIFQSGVRFRAYPTDAQAFVLRQWIGCQRNIYNAKVAEDRLFAAQRRMVLRSDPDAVVRTPLDRLYGQFKDPLLTPFLSAVPSQILREGTYRWFNAKQRQLKGLAKSPAPRNRHNFNSVLLCSDLFAIESGGANKDAQLRIGTPKFPVGVVRIHAHRDYGQPKMLSVREQNGKWFVSFSYEHQVEELIRAPHEVAYELNSLDDAALQEVTLGIDRNVSDNCAASSDGQFHRIESVCLERIERKAAGLKRQQRRLARCKKGSNNRRKAVARVAAKHAYKTEVIKDFCHQTSYKLVNGTDRLIVFEDLKIQNMVRAPKPKVDGQTGKWIKNGAASKAGLSKSILSSGWGRLQEYTSYKAARVSKLTCFVPPHYTSQECSGCGHTQAENRNQSVFFCLKCSHKQHADLNAADNIVARGMTLLRSGELEKVRAVRRTAVKRKVKTGAGRPGVSVECLQDAASGVRTRAAAHDTVKQKAQAARPDAPT